MKQIFIIISMVLAVLVYARITEQNNMFGTDDEPAALDTLTNADTSQTRTIIFDEPDEMGGSISVSGYIVNLTGDTVAVTPEWARVYAKYDTRLGPWHAFAKVSGASATTITCAAGTDSIKYELNISDEAAWQFGWGYAVRYIASGTHTTKIESIGSHR